MLVRRTPVELSLLAEHQRGYGSLYGALNHGRLDTNVLRDLLVSLPLPRFDGRIVLTVDVSPWLRSDAACSPERLFCLVHGRNGRSSDHVVPGWPYSFVAVLTPDRTSWTQVLDAVRLGPTDDAAAVTADQLRAVVERLVTAGQWQDGDRNILVVMDLAKPETWPEPTAVTLNDTPRYGKAEARAWDRLHPRLTHRSAWIDLDGELPLIEGTMISLKADHLPGDRDAPPVWLWSSATGAPPDHVDFVWSCYLRRFDLEHTFRLLKQSLGWTRPRLRDPQAADRWTWLVIAAHTQLRLALPRAADRRKPWEKTTRTGTALTPTRVRRGFRNIRPHLGSPARAPKPTRPGARTTTRFEEPTPHHPLRRGQDRQTPRDTRRSA